MRFADTERWRECFKARVKQDFAKVTLLCLHNNVIIAFDLRNEAILICATFPLVTLHATS